MDLGVRLGLELGLDNSVLDLDSAVETKGWS